MKLKKYRVTNFRSVNDSGWIDCDDVTTLVGTNEAGKSNLLLALWKLKPAGDGEINPLQDMPRSKFSEWRQLKEPPEFIEAVFVPNDSMVEELRAIYAASKNTYGEILVARDFNGNYRVEFPNKNDSMLIDSKKIIDLLKDVKAKVESESEKGKGEAGYKDKILKKLTEEIEKIKGDSIASYNIQYLKTAINSVSKSNMKSSTLSPIIKELVTELQNKYDSIPLTNPENSDRIREKIISELPSFVYYSNYGNLDSEIYLPHVIENMGRDNLSGSMAAKARTLKVLFDFVRLNPQEILELGTEPSGFNQYQQAIAITDEKIQETAEKKKERDILLQSASARLSKEFRDWWKQGDYRFRFAADGSHFRIWVSDDSRPDEVELEGRSTGLQWFLSFYLVFLVESNQSHKNSILLLDEAGQSLHPLAQKDLATFFDGLAMQNQILHTTHSPFLINTDNINRARVVYIDESGHTVASSDLRAGNIEQSKQRKSVYAVHAALGLSVSEILLQGCKTVVVEGPSDQYYLSGIKSYLIGEQLINPNQEIIFVPAGGVRGIASIASILSSKAEDMPIVIIDSDKSGKDLKNKLNSELYKGIENKIIEMGEIVSLDNAEIEDLIPSELIVKRLNRSIFREVEEEFEHFYVSGKPILGQIEEFAKENNITFEKGFKVDLARQVKESLLQKKSRVQISAETRKVWTDLFTKIMQDDILVTT